MSMPFRRAGYLSPCPSMEVRVPGDWIPVAFGLAGPGVIDVVRRDVVVGGLGRGFVTT